MKFRKLNAAFKGFATGATTAYMLTESLSLPEELKLAFSGVSGLIGAFIGNKADKEKDNSKSSQSSPRRLHHTPHINHYHHHRGAA
jgi:hypothetical protein